MLKQGGESLEGLTGYGITQKPYDGEDRVILVIIDSPQIILGEKKYSFEEYIASEGTWEK